MGNRIEAITHTLDLDESLQLHRKGWRVQPAGKAIILAIMFAGLLGLFGNGWLSKKTATAGQAQISYERFSRQDGETNLQVAMPGVSGRSAVSFPLAYIKSFEVTRVIPKPERSFIRNGQLWYVFEAEPNLQAAFHLRPKQRGNIGGSIYVNEENIPIHHYIFP